MNSNSGYEVYQIGDANNNYAITLNQSKSIYDGANSYRKARLSPFNPDQSTEIFIDKVFPLVITENDVNEKNKKYALRRIYQIYDEQFNIFAPKHMQDIPLKPREFYPTFLSELSMIDKYYLQTLFMTKTVNKKGLYRYFVRRNGEYHVQVIDDLIPVDPETSLPPWGLNKTQVWKILMMKAWLKQKGSIKALVDAEPYQFIHAFGFPGYRALSIRKQINHIAVSTLSKQSKIAKQQRIPIDVAGYIVVGKTKNNPLIAKMGLVPNRAGYRIIKTQFETVSRIQDSKINHIKEYIYKVVSSLPSSWVGQFSIFTNGKIHTSQYKNLPQEIGRIQSQFFATYQQICQVFSKFYLVPQYNSNKLAGKLLQDSFSVKYKGPDSYYVFEMNVQNHGFINLNIDLPWDSALDINQKKSANYGNQSMPVKNKQQNVRKSKRFSYIKYFMAKREKVQNNKELKEYSYYDGQYVKGYHKSCNRFLEIQPGIYYIYFKVLPNEQLSTEHFIGININSNAKIQNFQQVNPVDVHFPNIMQAALHNFNRRYGLKSYVDIKNAANSRNLVAHISNSLDQIGFGVISISAKAPTDMMLAMNIKPEYLHDKDLVIVKEAHFDKINENGLINIVVHQGQAKTVIVQRLFRRQQIPQAFPPANSVDFYHIM